ncbi:RING-H2 finger A2A [Euphorbia peplus]|nr:RING-H2 finger A2A [Euphorbia peplus]
MGLQSQLNDVSSDSIPLLLVAIIAKSIHYLRSFIFSLLYYFGLLRFHPIDQPLISSALLILADQLNLNRAFSYRYSSASAGGGSDCVFCLSALKDGDKVRKLDCCHVFHKHCFDGWLDHLNFDCPLCRRPLISENRVEVTRRRVGMDLVEWFSYR